MKSDVAAGNVMSWGRGVARGGWGWGFLHRPCMLFHQGLKNILSIRVILHQLPHR